MKAELEQQMENPSRKIAIEKIVLSCGGVEKELDKAKKLLERMTGRKTQILISKKRIPNFNVRPGLEVGARITIRGEEASALLKRLLEAINNTLKFLEWNIKEILE